jgi:flagellar hook-associated protein 2
MAVSSATGGSVLDVAGLVTSLMQAENIPVTKLDTKIGTLGTKISMLGNFMGKVSTFQAALTKLADSASFTSRATTSTNSALVSASASSTAAAGALNIHITSSASAQQTVLLPTTAVASGSADLAAPQTLNFTDSDGSTRSFTGASLNALSSAINSAKRADGSAFPAATLVQTGDAAWGLRLSGSATGAANSFTVAADDVSAWAVTAAQAASDAQMTVNGVPYTRSTNSFANVVPGVTLTINQAVTSAADAQVTVASGSSTASAAVQQLAGAYNDMLTSYQSLTRSGQTAAERGVLNSDSALHNFMFKVQQFFTAGVYDSAYTSDGATPSDHVRWSSAGVTFQRDGTLAVDATKLSTAMDGDLGSILSKGALFGSARSGSSMGSFLTAALASDGMLGGDKTSLNANLTDFNDQRTRLTERLTLVQAAYTKRYAALDAQLSGLQSTSTSLTSSLDALAAQTSSKK